jgi:hypothetical protein
MQAKKISHKQNARRSNPPVVAPHPWLLRVQGKHGGAAPKNPTIMGKFLMEIV